MSAEQARAQMQSLRNTLVVSVQRDSVDQIEAHVASLRKVTDDYNAALESERTAREKRERKEQAGRDRQERGGRDRAE